MDRSSPFAAAIRAWSCSASVGGFGHGPVPTTAPAPASSGRAPALHNTQCSLVFQTYTHTKTHTHTAHTCSPVLGMKHAGLMSWGGHFVLESSTRVMEAAVEVSRGSRDIIKQANRSVHIHTRKHTLIFCSCSCRVCVQFGINNQFPSRFKS